jgi:hypothetical protein
MKRQGYHSPAPAIDSAVDYSPSHFNRAVGVSNKLRGKFNERTNRTANLRGYRARKAKLLWLKLRAGELDPQTAAAVARDHAQAFARFDKAAARKEAA